MSGASYKPDAGSGSGVSEVEASVKQTTNASFLTPRRTRQSATKKEERTPTSLITQIGIHLQTQLSALGAVELQTNTRDHDRG